MTSNNKTSILVKSQLPAHIADNADYSKFVEFVQAYYEWMESANIVNTSIVSANSYNQGALYGSKNLTQYFDIDTTLNDFVSYYTNDFLPYFPEDALLDKRKAIKIAKELYGSKGTPASYKFLFRVLYNSDFEVFFTKDVVLKASAGEWYVSRSLKLSSTDENFLNVNNYRIFGETSKSIATIENSLLNGTKIDLYLSEVQRLFLSGEFVRVVDNSGQNVLFNGQPLRAKVVGQISNIRINPKNRGQFYTRGDPVIVYGGLNSTNGLGALAQVANTTTGSIQRINVIDGGYGYRLLPNTTITITGSIGATAEVASLDSNPKKTANVTNVVIDIISSAQATTIGNTMYSFLVANTSNANTTLANAFSTISFVGKPISAIQLTNGGGQTSNPLIIAQSLYDTRISDTKANIRNLGILAPIVITNGGIGYVANDVIVFTGGSGYGANAIVTSVAANGAIIDVEYVSGILGMPEGGMGYKSTSLPSLTINSANGSATGAILSVPGILGDGAVFSAVTDKVGEIINIDLLSNGEDYISQPNVSLKIEDIIVSNVVIGILPKQGDVIFQGANLNVATYSATVNSVSLLSVDENPALSLYNLRVFEYNSRPNTQLQLKVTDKNINLNMANTAYAANAFFIGSPEYDVNGIKIYGDGLAKASATFLNGLVISEGQYISQRGHPSGTDVLQDENYNNFTYQITVEKEIAKYRDVLLKMLHPTGTKVIGRYAMKSNNALNMHIVDAIRSGQTLYYYTSVASSNVTMTTDFTTKSTNILQFNNLGTGVNLADVIFANSIIKLSPTNGPNVVAEVSSVNSVSNTVTTVGNTWLTFANVAFVNANATTTTINILSLTNSYNIINNGVYSNTAYPLKDIVYVGDYVLVANNSERQVTAVNYTTGTITVSSAISANASNGYMSVRRTFSAGGTLGNAYQVVIYGLVGQQYTPELITESGQTIITEDDRIILLG